jgi:uncharacterized membrane protein YebE (DUF533 family)
MSALQKRRSLKASPHLSAGGGVLDALMSSFNRSKNKLGRKKKKKSSRYALPSFASLALSSHFSGQAKEGFERSVEQAQVITQPRRLGERKRERDVSI